MLRYALRSLLARRRRTVLTALAVVVGVAMIAGAYVFTDTIDAALRETLSTQTSGAEIVVASPQGLYSAANPPAAMPASLAARIARLPGVARAQGQVVDAATVVGRNGRVIAHPGSPALALSYLPAPLGGPQLVRGTAPRGPGEVVLERSTAARGGYRVGEVVPIVTGEPLRRFRVAGIARLGGASIGAATAVVFDLGTAQALYDRRGLVNAIYVAGNGRLGPRALAGEIAPLLPRGVSAQPTPAALDANLAAVAGRLTILTGGLRAFGFIAMFAGAFVIFNTLAITVAQRARELGLLRALGATAGQVFASVLLEAGAIGVVSSVAGLVAGPAVALLMRAVLAAVGIQLPSTRLALEPRAAIVAFGVGLGVSIAAGLLPAVRATRATPIEALQHGASPAANGRARLVVLGPALTLALIGAGVASTASGSSSARLAAATVGATVLLVAAVVLVPVAIPALVRVLALPLERRGRIVARLARENATRTPTRTAITASSLMIGLAVVLFLAVYSGGVRTAARRAIARAFVADYAIASADGSSSIPAATGRALGLVPDVLAASGIRSASARVPGAGRVSVAGIDTTTIGQVYRFQWVGGKGPDLATLGPGDALLERDTALGARAGVGARVTVAGPDGSRTALTVRGIYADRGLLQGMALPVAAFDRLFDQDRLQLVLIKLIAGVDRTAVLAQLQQTLATLPGVVVRSERQLAAQAAGRMDAILVLLYALLAVSGVMALLGLINALALSIHERTRELGVLRAIGMTRAQLTAMVIDESLITAAVGTLVGVALGVGLAWAVHHTLSAQGIVFALPWVPVALAVAVGLLVGVLAALAPAARAARLDVLSALAHE